MGKPPKTANFDDDSVKKLLADLLTYARAGSALSAKQRANEVIDTLEKAKIYKSLDGLTTHDEIADLTNNPRETVRNWIREFSGYGIVSQPNEFYSHHKALFSLDDLGIDLDTLRAKPKKKKLP